jgi:hypothetical protein
MDRKDQESAHRVVARFEREASDEIELAELPDPQQELVKHVGAKPTKVWESVHGYVVDFEHGPMGNRFTKDFLHKFTSSSVFRWIEPANARGGFSVGM